MNNTINISNPEKYKAALYIRLSKEDAKINGESESICNQRSILQEFAKKQNITIYGEYVDDGVSGTTFDRPSFKRLLEDIQQDKINMILTKDLSRLGRDYIQTGYYLEKYFPENNIRYLALLDGIDTESETPSNDITPFRAVFNDMYAKDISNKIKSVKHNKQMLGLFIGGKAPFGYTLNKKIPNKIFIDEEAKPIIERIFHEAVNGVSCRKIAANLNFDKIPTPSLYAVQHGIQISRYSSTWSDSRIREIIQNEVYIGNMVQGRMKKLSYKSKKNIRLPKEEWKIVKKTHDPIIDLKTFQKANEMLALRKQTRIKSHDYLLKGLVHCHECRKKMNCSSRHLASGIRYYFRCSTNLSKSVQKCTPHSMPMDLLENFITSMLRKLIIKYFKKNTFENIFRKLYYKHYNSSNYIQNISAYKNELTTLNLQIDKLYNDRLCGLIDDTDFKRIYISKKKMQTEINNKIVFLYNQDSFNITNIMQNIENKFEHNLIINKKILTDFIEKIEIDSSKKIYIYFKFKSIH